MYMFSYMRHEPRPLTFMKIYAKTWFPYKVARAFSERGKRKFTRSLYLNAHYVNRHKSILLKSAFSVFFPIKDLADYRVVWDEPITVKVRLASTAIEPIIVEVGSPVIAFEPTIVEVK
jgi:hypothetical protein